MNRQSYRVLFVGGKEVYEHRVIAERVLGRHLKDEECIHHADENGHNNRHGNLVICPSNDYHKLLHYRIRALNESGNADYMKCEICGQWDDKKNVTTLHYKPSERTNRRYRTRSYHPRCNAEKASAQYAKKRALKALGYVKCVL